MLFLVQDVRFDGVNGIFGEAKDAVALLPDKGALELQADKAGGTALELMHKISRGETGPHGCQDMDMVVCPADVEEGAVQLLGLVVQPTLEIGLNIRRDVRLAVFGCPDKMVEETPICHKVLLHGHEFTTNEFS